MFKKIDHIGVAVKNLETLGSFFEEKVGIKLSEPEVVEEQKVKAAFIKIGESKIELMESTSPEGAIGKFIEKKGEGFQHIAFSVTNIEEKLAQLKEKGVQLIDQTPRIGAGGKKIAFLHPKSTSGILVELCEGEE